MAIEQPAPDTETIGDVAEEPPSDDHDQWSGGEFREP
jgi:hypothetical protein